mmetsp:Transcript_107368/g.309117  ORF Transcript_107368/g.309117 Transcript_107368/m.309117 type:complete len:244 (+) Transcript_107368:326-1057(+)
MEGIPPGGAPRRGPERLAEPHAAHGAGRGRGDVRLRRWPSRAAAAELPRRGPCRRPRPRPRWLPACAAGARGRGVGRGSRGFSEGAAWTRLGVHAVPTCEPRPAEVHRCAAVARGPVHHRRAHYTEHRAGRAAQVRLPHRAAVDRALPPRTDRAARRPPPSRGRRRGPGPIRQLRPPELVGARQRPAAPTHHECPPRRRGLAGPRRARRRRPRCRVGARPGGDAPPGGRGHRLGGRPLEHHGA